MSKRKRVKEPELCGDCREEYEFGLLCRTYHLHAAELKAGRKRSLAFITR